MDVIEPFAQVGAYIEALIEYGFHGPTLALILEHKQAVLPEERVPAVARHSRRSVPEEEEVARPWVWENRAMHEKRAFEVIVEEQDDGGYVASVPDLPGLWTQGETRDEAIAMVKDAVTGYLGTLDELGMPIPDPHREKLTIEA